MSRRKSSSAGYRISSIARFSRWISSMKRTSRASRPVRIAAMSPFRSSAGPATVLRPTPSSSRTLLGREPCIDRGERPLGLDDGESELHQSVSGNQLDGGASSPGLDSVSNRALELEDDSLGRLLADARNDLEARRIVERDGSAELVGRPARDHGERDLRPDPGDAEQTHEEVALVRVRK